jgi:PIN domain nuclease of toxin-antitoxin system
MDRSLTMQLLLDTHIWICALHSPQKLSHAVRRQLENPKNQPFLSPVSIWEARHLVRRKRLRIKHSFSG